MSITYIVVFRRTTKNKTDYGVVGAYASKRAAETYVEMHRKDEHMAYTITAMPADNIPDNI